MKNIPAFLTELGLSVSEAETYEIALGLGAFPASIIASRLNMPRSTARYTCESLVRKGLMVETKKANTKLFVAENPTKLFSILNTEEERLTRKKEQLVTTMKELQQMYNPDAKIPKFAFYEWIDGMERMLGDLLKVPISGDPPATLYAFGAMDYIALQEPAIIKKFRSKSLKKYKTALIMRPEKYRSLYPNGTDRKRYFQFIDELKVDIQITEDTLAILSFDAVSPIWLVIRHQDIAHAFGQVFMELWKRSGKEAGL